MDKAAGENCQKQLLKKKKFENYTFLSKFSSERNQIQPMKFLTDSLTLARDL